MNAVQSVLADFTADQAIGQQCVEIAEKVRDALHQWVRIQENHSQNPAEPKHPRQSA